MKWFPVADGESPTGTTFHAVKDGDNGSLCGEVKLEAGVETVDEVPDNGVAHLGCREAIDALSPAGYTPAEPETETIIESQTITSDDVAVLSLGQAEGTEDESADETTDSVAADE